MEATHMIELVHTLSPKEPLEAFDVFSFLTANYIGLWDCRNCQFALMPKEGDTFQQHFIPECPTYDELDQKVFDKIKEHVLSISATSNFSITLNE